jgi:ABC-type multidrug transport system ATPase subunit
MSGLEIHLENVGKRYLRRWIFRDLSYRIPASGRIGVTGYNGSGKSTLLKIVIGALAPSTGAVTFGIDGTAVDSEKVFRHLAFAAPYTDLIEEMNLMEFLGFHSRFRPLRPGLDSEDVVQLLGNQFRTNTHLKSYSSGMKQRVRLALAVCTEASAVVLDEPTSNLDEEGKEWYANLLQRLGPDTTVLIASNEARDMEFCHEFIHIPAYSDSK